MCEERNNWFAEKPNHSFDDVTEMDELKTAYLAEQILQEREPTLEELEQMLAANGELEELIDLSGLEELD